MRFVNSHGLYLLSLLLLAANLGHTNRLNADDEPMPEPLPAPVKEALDKYLSAVAAKDIKAMNALAAVPWLDRDRKVVRERAELDKSLERMATQLPKNTGQRELATFPFKKARAGIKDEKERKLLDEVLGMDGWVVVVEPNDPFLTRIVLVRVKDGKPAVVGGPLKENQVHPANRIPDAVERLLDKADTFELYSLDGDTDKNGKFVPAKDGFHGCKEVGKIEVKDKAKRQQIADAVRLGAEDNPGYWKPPRIPHHALRLKEGEMTIDLVFGFQDYSVQVFENGEKKKGFATSPDPQKLFDAMLTEGGIKLPKGKKN
jgi:hypothetical protein